MGRPIVTRRRPRGPNVYEAPRWPMERHARLGEIRPQPGDERDAVLKAKAHLSGLSQGAGALRTGDVLKEFLVPSISTPIWNARDVAVGLRQAIQGDLRPAFAVDAHYPRRRGQKLMKFRPLHDRVPVELSMPAPGEKSWRSARVSSEL